MSLVGRGFPCGSSRHRELGGRVLPIPLLTGIRYPCDVLRDVVRIAAVVRVCSSSVLIKYQLSKLQSFTGVEVPNTPDRYPVRPIPAPVPAIAHGPRPCRDCAPPAPYLPESSDRWTAPTVAIAELPPLAVAAVPGSNRSLGNSSKSLLCTVSTSRTRAGSSAGRPLLTCW